MIHRTTQRAALTLLEVVISVGLIVLLTMSLFAFYDVSLRSRAGGERMISRVQLARSILYRIAEEIRSANGFLPGIGPGISGLRHEIKLQTLAVPDRTVMQRRDIKAKPLPAQSDIREVRYYLAVDPETTEPYIDPESPETVVDAPATLGIVRREVRTLFQPRVAEDRPGDVDLDLITAELRYLRFRYFDGVEWVDQWQPPQGGLGNSLPQAVEVTIGAEPEVPEDPTELDLSETEAQESLPEVYSPDRYTLVVRLNQADTFLGSRLMRASKRAFGGGGLSGLSGLSGKDGGS
ncbi:MAG: type II secretion system protein GspJ [Phycisphaerae bacterium]|nr:type II secretion system protein GspJ [Phycisphaerae bacterium]